MRFDVIAIGGGFAGLVTANRAAQLGLKALVLEKQADERYACNSRWTTGISHILFQDMRLDGDTLERVIMEGSAGHADPALAKVFAHNSKRAIDWLRDEGARVMEINAPTGRSIILAPPRRFTAGLDWEGRGGDVVLRRLEENLAKRGGELRRGVEAKALAMKNGACAGVDGLEARAVVIADGGFPANRDMLKRYVSDKADRLLIRAAPSATGDGLRMAEAAGAELKGFGQFYGHPVHRDAVTRGNAQLWPFPMIDALTQAGIVVGADGRRFADEGRGGIALANAIAQLDDPLSATLLFDDAIWNGIGREGPTGNPMITQLGATLHKANDVKALAALAGLPPDALAATVKGTALARPPFYAVPLCSGVTATMGGIAVDTGCRALRADGTPIRGLYAAGSTVAGLEGGPNVAYVGGLSKAFVLGLLAAEAIAADVVASKKTAT